MNGFSQLYNAVYKCRLCGEIYTDCFTGRCNATQISIALVSGQKPSIAAAPQMQAVHYCRNHGIGIADFQGWAEYLESEVQE